MLKRYGTTTSTNSIGSTIVNVQFWDLGRIVSGMIANFPIEVLISLNLQAGNEHITSNSCTVT